MQQKEEEKTQFPRPTKCIQQKEGKTQNPNSELLSPETRTGATKGEESSNFPHIPSSLQKKN